MNFSTPLDMIVNRLSHFASSQLDPLTDLSCVINVAEYLLLEYVTRTNSVAGSAVSHR